MKKTKSLASMTWELVPAPYQVLSPQGGPRGLKEKADCRAQRETEAGPSPKQKEVPWSED
jgi:hypothetical protein